MPLATIAGRVPVVAESIDFPGQYWIRDGFGEVLSIDGNWLLHIDPSKCYWPTESAALSFARECADKPDAMTTTNEGRALPDAPGLWFKDGREFFVHRVHGDSRLGVYVLDCQGYTVFSPITNWSPGNWQPATPPAELAALRAECERLTQQVKRLADGVVVACATHAETIKRLAAAVKLLRQCDVYVCSHIIALKGEMDEEFGSRELVNNINEAIAVRDELRAYLKEQGNADGS